MKPRKRVEVALSLLGSQQRVRHRAKLAEVVDSERVLAELARAYDRAYAGGQIAIRAGVKKLLRRCGRDATAHDRWLRQRAAARRKRKKR